MRIVALVWTGALVGCGDGGGSGREPQGADAPPVEAPVDAAERTHRTVPLLGGTLLGSEDADVAYAADPEGDRLLAFDTAARTQLWTVYLPDGSVPFRLVEADGALFATLRGAAAIARVDLATQALTTVAACAEPRGITWDADGGVLWVACASGELEKRDRTGALLSSTWIDGDLRDVVAHRGELFVSRFRAAEVLTISASSMEVLDRRLPPAYQGLSATGGVPEDFEPRVAWRLVKGVEDDVVMSNQVHQTSMLSPGTMPSTQPAYYTDSTSTSCGIANTVVTSFPLDGGEPVRTPPLGNASLPADLAWSGDGWRLVSGGFGQVLMIDGSVVRGDDVCTFLPASFDRGMVTSVAFDGGGREIVLTGNPFGIYVDGQRITVESNSGEDVAFTQFHAQTPSQLACASCHPEGSDDAHVWNFGWDGLRRTQNLAIGLSETAPFHWNGILGDMSALIDDVMVNRMLGPQLTPKQGDDLLHWIDGLPPVRVTPSGDAAAIARGKALFESAELACTTCHAGAHFTTPENVDIGKGEMLQTPSLIGVSGRGPWMHDGCAQTLEQRFLDLECGGATHGGVVDPADVPDMVAYLETL